VSAGWLQLRLEVAGEDPGPVEDALLAAGAVAVTLDDAGDNPIYEPGPGELPLWPTTRITGLFPGVADADVLRAVLAGALSPLPPHEFLHLDDRTWEREWLKDFRPMRFGTRLWVVPGEHTPPDPDGVNLLLDPGLAFGTGTHATTALCLEWLDGAAGDLQGARVTDYGCGSGVLAVAAALLGAREVLAVDNDPQALVATRANAERNGVADRIRACLPDEAPEAWRCGWLVANILAAPLVSLAPRFERMLEPGGQIAMSGLIERQVDEVRAAYVDWCALDEARVLDGWVRLSGAKR
jgi:ribosomal protein L11 methyltransferase